MEVTHVSTKPPFGDASSGLRDPGPVVVAFFQVSGLLGGFCVTILVLALTPSVFPTGANIDWLTATLLLASGVFIASAGILANAQNTLVLEHRVRLAAFAWGIVLFHVANMLLSVAFILIAYQFPLPVTHITAVIICVFAGIVALVNIRPLAKVR